ncbi:MAG TPA: hypothetical protein VJP89_10185 [Pyrinomonadaceae bacterium]|nr:hypothetical protein [Pyrinomonadaceae bacterium]
MNLQTQSTSGDHDPGTPVIIKTGGNQGEGRPIGISSPEMPFIPIVGSAIEGWKKSLSTTTGRICELRFKDGALPYQFCTISPQAELLASLEVHRVADKKTLFEVKETWGKGSILLEISCFDKVGFKVRPETKTDEGWKDSETETEFSGSDIKIIFKQGEMSLEYTFSFSEIEFTIYFPVPVN